MGIFYIRLITCILCLHFHFKFCSSDDSLPYLTNAEHKTSGTFLEREIASTYSSDADDQAEVVAQVADETLGVTYYNLVASGGNNPVFVSVGTKNMGKDVIVLLRGEDYLDPMNKDRFVVLRKRSSGEYNVHIALIWRDPQHKMHVNWENVLVSLQPKISDALNYLTQQYVLVESHTKGSIRPLCGWFGVVLLCDSKVQAVGTGGGNVDDKNMQNLEKTIETEIKIHIQEVNEGAGEGGSSMGGGDSTGGSGGGSTGGGGAYGGSSTGGGSSGGGSKTGSGSSGGGSQTGGGSSGGGSKTGGGSSGGGSQTGGGSSGGGSQTGGGSSGGGSQTGGGSSGGGSSTSGGGGGGGSKTSGGGGGSSTGGSSTGGSGGTSSGGSSTGSGGGTSGGSKTGGGGASSGGGSTGSGGGTSSGGSNTGGGGSSGGSKTGGGTSSGGGSTGGAGGTSLGGSSSGGSSGGSKTGGGGTSSGGSGTGGSGGTSSGGTKPSTGGSNTANKNLADDESSEEKQFFVYKGAPGKSGSVVTKTKS